VSSDPTGPPAPADYMLVVRVWPDEVPAGRRLARWLKLGLRAFGVRVLTLSPVEPEAPRPTSGPVRGRRLL
jgi:hypothetical protein